MSSSNRPLVALVALVGVAVLGLVGCTEGSSGSAGAEGTPSTAAPDGDAVLVPADAVIVDVRTPAEFAEGHVEGAVNIDVQSPDFAARLSALDPGAPTVVYCRTGNRSAAAVVEMAESGFTDLTDLGSVQEAAEATGLPVVG
jgi:rhodanese-related sulfurtransferase